MNRFFKRTVAAVAIVEFALLAVQTVILLQAFRITDGSVRWLGTLVLVALATSAVAPLVGARLVHSLGSNRRTLLFCYGACTVLIFILAHNSHIWGLFWLQIAISASYWTASPARQAIVRELVNSRQLLKANSIDATCRGLAMASGAAIGASMFACAQDLRPIAYLIGFANAAALLLITPGRAAVATAMGTVETRRARLRDQLSACFGEIAQHRLLLFILAMTVVSGLAVGLIDPLLRPFVDARYGGGDAVYAQLLLCFGAGSVLGPWLGAWSYRRLNPARTVIAAFLSEAVIYLIWSQSSQTTTGYLLFFFWGLNNFAFMPCQANLVHTLLPANRQPIMFAVLDNVNFAAQLLAVAVVALLIDQTSSAVKLLLIAAQLYCICCAIAAAIYLMPRSWGSASPTILNPTKKS